MKLENLKMYPFETTLMGVVKGALDYFGSTMSPGMAFGGSGHAFLINIHEEICPSGPYCWNYEGFLKLLPNLGLEMVDLGFFHPGNTPDDRAKIEQTLRQHLDNGLPCSFCNMENQLIYGYEGDKLLLALPWPKPMEITPATLTFGTWAEFGKEVHVNFFVFRRLARKDDATIIRDSLNYAIDLFRNPEKHSQEHYGIGLRAYDNWLKAVKAGHGCSHGNWWNAVVWSECRTMAADYFSEIASRSSGKTADLARELSRDYKYTGAMIARVGNKDMPAEEKTPILSVLRGQEERAIGKVEELLKLLS